MQPKKNPDRSYGAKLVTLFAKLLFTGERYSLTELARQLDCSKQTVLRLVDDITLAYDVPIREDLQGNRKYVWIERAERIPPAALISQSELRTLQMCQAFTRHLLGTASWQEAARAIEKSCHHLPPREEPGDEAFGVIHTGRIDYSRHEDSLRTLLQGMDRRRVCKVRYKRLMGERAKTFYIKPLKIFAHHETVYVHARLAPTPGKPYRTPRYDPLLALHRLEKVEVTDALFRRPAGYDFERVMNREFGVFAQRRFRAVLDLTGWAAAIARERQWSPDQVLEQRGEVTRLSFWSTSEPEVLSLVLSFGANAKLVEPERLVAEVRRVVGEVAGMYGAERTEPAKSVQGMSRKSGRTDDDAD